MKSLKCLILLEAFFLFIAPEVNLAGTVKDYRFYSQALKREMTCRVYLPEAYEPNNSENRFPVIYFLHGASLAYDKYDAIYSILDYLIVFQQIKPVIVVVPDGLAPPYNGSFYTNSELYGNFEDFINDDLVSFMDSAFYTKNVRSQRAIMGASMGGYGALKIAMKHQEKYVAVAGHSSPANINMMDIFIPDLIAEDGGTTPFHWSPGPGKSLTNLTFTMAGAFSPNLNKTYLVDFPLDSLAKPIPGVMERWKKENICEIAKEYRPGANLGIHFDCGNLDDYYLYYQNRSLADTLTKYNIAYTYEEYLGTHTSGLPVRVSLSFVYFSDLFQSDVSNSELAPTGLSWVLFPNPASNAIAVCSNNSSQSQQTQTIQMTDGTGRLVISERLKDGVNQINTSNLPVGLYFFKIQCGKAIQTGKTMIIR